MVTVETAVVLVGLVVVVAFAGFALTVGVAQVRCVDAARDAARAAARGESNAASVEIGRRSAPADATIAIDRAGSQIVVRVDAVVRPPGVLSRLAGLPVHAHAAVEAEPGVGDAMAEPARTAAGPP